MLRQTRTRAINLRNAAKLPDGYIYTRFLLFFVFVFIFGTEIPFGFSQVD
jgi:hypothetical protein